MIWQNKLRTQWAANPYRFKEYWNCISLSLWMFLHLRAFACETSTRRAGHIGHEEPTMKLWKYEVMTIFNNVVSFSTMFMTTSQHNRSRICVKYQCRSLQLFVSDLSVLLALLSSTSETSSSGAPVTFKQLVKIELVLTLSQFTSHDREKLN